MTARAARTPIALTALALASVALSACGGEPDSSAKSDKEKFQDAALKHARCMRQNGVDFPDPKPGKGGVVMMQRSGKNSNPQKMRAAEQKCKHFIEDVKPPEMSEKQKREEADRALAHARCLRKEGIDTPDPQIDPNGGIRQSMKVPPGDEARVRRAEEKCQQDGNSGPMFEKAR